MTPEESRLALLLDHLVEPPPQPAVDALAAELARLESARTADASPRRRAPLAARQWLPAAAAAAAVLALVVTLQVTQPSHSPVAPAGTAPVPTNRNTAQPAPTTRSSSTSPRAADLPWQATPVGSLALSPGSLLAADGGLFGLRQSTSGQQLIRIDPGTGAVLAAAPAGTESTDPVLAAGSLWLLSGPSNGGNTATLTRFDPQTLDTLDTTAVHMSASPAVGATVTVDPAGSLLYVAAGDGIVVVDARTGHQTRRIGGVTDVSGLALAPDGSRLYAATMPQDGSSALYTLDPATGDVLNRQSAQDSNISTLVATAGGAWVFGGSGMTDTVVFAPDGDLADARTESTGGGGLYPDVHVSNGLAWLGGPDRLACADPDTGAAFATTQVRSSGGAEQSLTDITIAGGQAYGLYRGPGTDAALVEVTPPAACRAHATPRLGR